MRQVRSQLRQRFQDEAPLAHARMGNLQFARANDEVSEQQNIDIDGAGAFRALLRLRPIPSSMAWARASNSRGKSSVSTSTTKFRNQG